MAINQPRKCDKITPQINAGAKLQPLGALTRENAVHAKIGTNNVENTMTSRCILWECVQLLQIGHMFCRFGMKC